MGLANRLHQVWADGAIQAISNRLELFHQIVLPHAVVVYGYGKRLLPELRCVSVSKGKLSPIISIHPSKWTTKVNVICAILAGYSVVLGKDWKFLFATIGNEFIDSLCEAMPDLPGNTDKLNPPSKGRMRLYRCQCGQWGNGKGAGFNIRTGRADLSAMCLLCGANFIEVKP